MRLKPGLSKLQHSVEEIVAEKVTIITAVYNDRRVTRALYSVLMQRAWDEDRLAGDDVEIIVVDDSDDITRELVDAYGDAIKVIRPERRQGVYHARNLGIEAATGEIIGFLNADDEYVDERVLADVVRAFRQPHAEGRTPGMVHGYIQVIDHHGRPRRWIRDSFGKWQAWPRWTWKFGYGPRDPAVFWHRSTWEKFGPYRTDLPIVADGEFLLRSCCRGDTRVHRVDRVLTNMAMGGLSRQDSFGKAVSMAKEGAEAWRMAGVGPPWLYICYCLYRYLASRTIRGAWALVRGRR